MIAALERQAIAHGRDIDCEVWIYDKKKQAMSATALPKFEFQPDERGNWLSLDFVGKHHDA